MNRWLLALLLAASAAHAQSEEKNPETAAGLSATVPGEKSVVTQPQSIGVLNRDDLQRNEGLFLDDTINLVPGVRLESRTVSGGQRITIRGYGNNTNFNGTGIKAYVDGVPITDAEGTTILDDLDPSTLGRVEVIKGPASSLYGQGIGGVVRFFTLRPDPDTSRLSQEVLYGTQNLLRTNTRYEYGAQDGSVVLNYGHQASDGYRVHSRDDKDFVLFTADYRPSAKQSISTYASYAHSFEQLAGQLTEDQYLANSNVAEPPYVANNGHVAIDSLRFGVSHKYAFARGLSNTTTLFGSGYQLNQPFAVGLTDNMSLDGGGRTEFNFRAGPVRAVVGTELIDTLSFRKSYALANQVVGALRGDLQVKSLQSNTFAQANLELPWDLTLTAGASLNYVRYAITDRLTAPGHLDQSGTRSFDPVVTPRLALEKAVTEDLFAYLQVSSGYTAPGTGNVVIPQIGMVNTGLKPERGLLYEVGAKGGALDDRITCEAALFELRVTDKLTPQNVVDPATGTSLYTQTVNAGAQNDRGLELSAAIKLLDDPAGAVQTVRVFGAYTYSNFRYDGFKSDANGNARTVDYTNNRVVGIPLNVFAAGLDALTAPGFYGNATFSTTGAVPLTFDNQHSAPGYSLLDAKIGYRHKLPEGFVVDASTGSKNLTGSTWYTMVFLNQSYSGAAPSVYLPGPSSPTFYGDVTVAKNF